MSHLRKEFCQLRMLISNSSCIVNQSQVWPVFFEKMKMPRVAITLQTASRYSTRVLNCGVAECSSMSINNCTRPLRRFIGLTNDLDALNVVRAATIPNRKLLQGTIASVGGRSLIDGGSLRTTAMKLSGSRMYSTNNREGNNEPRADMKGVVVHIPHPVEWLKNLCYLFIVRGWLDSSFNRQEFLFGAKQAICHMMRLAVLKDFDGMKLVSSPEVMDRMKELIASLSLEQLQSIEILPENINLANFTVSSVRHSGEGAYLVSIDVLCLAIRMFHSQPLLIQTIFRFKREYASEKQGDWRIANIQEFNIKELGMTKNEDGDRSNK